MKISPLTEFSWRRISQILFTVLVLWIGIEFIIFVHQLETGQPVTITRPPGVEAFLPIASLMSLRYWLTTGIFTPIHPSGLVIFTVILTIAIFLKKVFCSWVCPIGFLSEMLARVQKWIFGKTKFLPRWLDWPLRSLKYLLLGFFLWAILAQMDIAGIAAFLDSPYSRVSDIKMLKFFTDMSSLTARVLAGLFLLSILVPYFWCRFLCPYGALLGSLSWLSPFKIRRNAASCTDCKKCTRVCPSNIPVHKKNAVYSDECHACLTCVAACPVKNTLDFSTPKPSWKLDSLKIAVVITGLFLGSSLLARALGVWHNDITVQEYREHVRKMSEGIEYSHPGR